MKRNKIITFVAWLFVFVLTLQPYRSFVFAENEYKIGVAEIDSEEVTEEDVRKAAENGLDDIHWSKGEKEKLILLALSWEDFPGDISVGLGQFAKYIGLARSRLHYKVLAKPEGWTYDISGLSLNLHGTDNGKGYAYALVMFYVEQEVKGGEGIEHFLDKNSVSLNEVKKAAEEKEETKEPEKETDTPKGAEEGTAEEQTPEEETVKKAKAPRLTAGEDEAQTYNIIINYVFMDQTIAAEPFVVTLNAGEDFEDDIPNPVINGYEPYVGTSETTSESVHLSYTNIQANQQVVVTYMPAIVQYKVQHYLQNADNDDYTLVEEDVLEGVTGELVGNVEKDTFDGFYALLYTHPRIAADGSTIVEIPYDRYYFLMYFDLAGGVGVNPVYNRMGASVSIGTPSRPGYEFVGWDKPVPNKVPLGNETYTAQWNAVAAPYTVLYWYETVDGGWSIQASREMSATTGTTVNSSTFANDNFDGKDTTHFTHDASQDASYVVEGDGTTVVNVYYKRNTLTFRFNYDNGNVYTISGRWESTFESNGGHWPSDAFWRYANNSGGYTSMTFMEGFIPTSTMPNSGTIDFYETTRSGHDLYFYKENPDGTYNTDSLEAANDHVKSNGTFTITEKYTGFHVKDFRNNNTSASYVWSTDQSGHNQVTLDYVYIQTTSNSGTQYGFYEGEMVRLTRSGNSWSGYTWRTPSGATYTGSRYTRSTASTTGSMTGTYYAPVDGEMVRVYQTRSTGSWGAWRTATAGSSTISSDNYTYQIRFERTRYNLDFYNYNHYLDDKGAAVPYEAPLSTYGFTPDYPDDLPWGAYSFAGWYDNQELSGTPVNLTTAKMPANHMTLFAKWAPQQFTVNIYADLPKAEEATELLASHQLDYGTLCPVPEQPNRGEMQFIGWFYKDQNGTEMPFSFSATPVTSNLDVYAKWTSVVLRNYQFHFETSDGVVIADEISTSGLMGSTKTVSAKHDLYPGYETGWFPTQQSHSILIEDDETLNRYTFTYVQMGSVPYSVMYLDARTGAELAPTKTVSYNEYMYVTEKFLPIGGYVPDTFRKSIVIDADTPENNVIRFYYTKDPLHAYYITSHYTVQEGGKTRLYNELAELGTIGTNVTAEPIDISGYHLNTSYPGTVTSGRVVEEGLEMLLYYEPNQYPYYVRYLEDKTNVVLATEKVSSGAFQSTVTENAIEVLGYDLVSPQQMSTTILMDENGASRRNVITFYYKRQEAIFKFIPVPSEGGTVTVPEEHVAARTGIAFGSEAQANPGWEFVGWYLDAACTQPVSGVYATVDGAHILPLKSGGTIYSSRNFYAKFRQTVADVNVHMELRGEAAVMDDTFDYTLTLSKSGESYTGPISVTKNGVTEVIDFTGSYSFTMNHNDEITMKLPITYTYTITQSNNTGKPYAASQEVASAEVLPEGNSEEFINSLAPVAPSDVRTRDIPYGFVLVIGIMMIGATLILRRRREEEF